MAETNDSGFKLYDEPAYLPLPALASSVPIQLALVAEAMKPTTRFGLMPGKTIWYLPPKTLFDLVKKDKTGEELRLLEISMQGLKYEPTVTYYYDTGKIEIDCGKIDLG